MLGESWAAEGQVLADTVSFRAAQAAIDDGNRAGAVNSLGDVLALVADSTELRDALHSTLQAANPLKPSSCDVPLAFGLCGMTSRLTYISTQVPGPNPTSLQLTDGGLIARIRIPNPTLRVRVDGHVAGLRYDTTGLVRFSFVEEQLIVDLSVDSAGGLRASVRPGSVAVNIGSLSTSFDGLDGWILNNIIVPLAQGSLRDTVGAVVRSFGDEVFAGRTAALVTGLDVTTIGPVVEVARLDGATPITVRTDTRMTSFDTNGIRALAGMGLRFEAGAAHARPSLGVSVPAGTVLRDPLSSGQPLADAMHVSLLGQSLHALWRGGFFDAAVTEGGLDGLMPAGASVRVTTGLPPTVALRADDRVEIAIGAMNMHVDHSELPADGVDSSVGARISCARRLNGDALVLENCTVDELHLSPDAPLAESPAAALRQLVSDVVRSMAWGATQQALPALPVPGFRIPDSLALYGLTPGAVLGMVSPTIETDAHHLVLRSGFGIR
jgi:hypothetical protein